MAAISMWRKCTFSVETFACWIVWTFSTIFSLYSFCKVSTVYQHYLYEDDFRAGWQILNRKQDSSDQEWTVMKQAWISYWLWVAAHVFFCQIISRINLLSLMTFYTVFCMAFVTSTLGTSATVVYFMNVFLLLLVHRVGSKILCFLCSFSILFLLHRPQFSHLRTYLDLNDLQGFLFEVGLAWLNARCLSFTLDRIDERTHRVCTTKELLLVFGYSFYLPYFFTGPILNYVDFVQQMAHPARPGLNTKNIIVEMLRYAAIYYLLEFLLHFCYSSSIQFYPELVEQFDSWALVGLGYALPLMFCLKYKIIYGFVGTISQIDGLQLPPAPICVSRVHQCSQLWKWFDRGLHLWISRYLYAPLAGNRTLLRRVTASSVCFGFMALWHGMQASIFAWSFLNFVGVAAEMVILTFYKNHVHWRTDTTNALRLQALFGTFCFVHMCLGNIFFLSSWEIGIQFYQRIFRFPIPLVPMLLIMYCGCVVSIQLRGSEHKQLRQQSSS